MADVLGHPPHSVSAPREQTLESEDRVDTEGRLIVTAILGDRVSGSQHSGVVVDPIPADFGTHDEVGVRLVVDAKGQCVDVRLLTYVGVNTFVLIPLEASTDAPAIVHLVDQVLVDIERIANGTAGVVFGIQNVVLEEVRSACR